MQSTMMSSEDVTTQAQPSDTRYSMQGPQYNIPQPEVDPWRQDNTKPRESDPAPIDGFAELQNQDQVSKLAKSRALLMNENIKLMITTFKNKRLLDKELENEVKKLEKKGIHPERLEEYRLVLAGSEGWVNMNLEELNRFLEEKDKCLRVAASLEDVHPEKERKKEEKQVKKIQKYAEKMIKMKERRDAKEERRRNKIEIAVASQLAS